MKSTLPRMIAPFAVLVLLAGCGGKGIRLSSEDQKILNYCYLVLRPDVAEQLDLSGVQRVKMSRFAGQLRSILNVYQPRSDNPADRMMSESLNDLSTKTPRTLKLAEEIAAALDGAQRESFGKLGRRLRLAPVQPVTGSGQFILRYSLSGDEQQERVQLANGTVTKVVRVGGGKSSEWPSWLKRPDDVLEALQDGDAAIQQVGIEAAGNLDTEGLAPGPRSRIADLLLNRALDKNTFGLSRNKAIEALPDFVNREHRAGLLAIAAAEKGRHLSGAVAGLSRVAPNDAVALAVQNAGDFHRFNAIMRGFVQHGRDAQPALLRVDAQLKGKNRTWIQRALNDIGSGRQLEKQRPGIGKPGSLSRKS